MKRLLLVGWDAADWKLINPLLARGEMPNLATLIQDGVHGNIATIYPPLSPMLWTSIATAKRAHRHGIHGFSEPTEDGMSIRPITNLGRAAKAFWNILNQNGKRSVVAGWWPSHPAEPIRGAIVSDRFKLEAHHKLQQPVFPGSVWPPSRAGEMAELRIHPSEISGEILQMFVPEAEKVDQEKDKSLSDLAGIIAETMTIHAAATHLMEREQWDLAAIYYVGIDHFCHRFMRYHAGKVRGRPEETDPKIFSQIVANAYRYHDVMLGRLLALAGADSSVMLLSDHGFHSDRLLPDYIPSEAAGPAVEHRHFGIFCMRAPGVPRGGEVFAASVLDIAPTVLHLFGLPAGADMDGKVLINAFPEQTELPRIPSWEDVPGEDGRHPPSLRYDSVGAAESLQQLVELGYIAPPGDDARKNVARTVTENRYNLARACMDAGRLDLGSEILTELIARDPEQGRFHLHLIQCRLQQGRLAECRRVLDAFDDACMDFAPRAIEELKKRRAKKHDQDLDREDRAEMSNRRELAEKAAGFTLDRLTLRARLMLAQARSPGKKEAAREVLEQLAAAAGKAVAPALFLAESFAMLGEDQRALEYIRRVRRSDPENWPAIGLEASVHHSARRYQEAVKCAIESLALVYHQPMMHHLMGVALERLGERERAEHSYRVALSQMPGLVVTHLAMARLLRFDRTRLGEAALHMARANLLRKKAKERGGAKMASLAQETVQEPRTSADSGPGGASPPADRSQVVTIVSGLPRSGTSMMMQLLSAAGIPPYTDGRRIPDEDNPRGYFEHAQATRLHEDATWLAEARGKAVKIVAQLLPWLPATEQYRIVFMHRNLEEAVASQRAMLDRLGHSPDARHQGRLAQVYAGQLVRVQEWLRRAPGVQVLTVDYAQALADPFAAVARLAAFLGEPFDRPLAAAAVEPALRRQVAGIASQVPETL